MDDADRSELDPPWDPALRERLLRVARMTGARARACYWALCRAEGEVPEAQRLLLTPQRVALLGRWLDGARTARTPAAAGVDTYLGELATMHEQATRLLALATPRPPLAGMHAWVDARLGLADRVGIRRVVGATLEPNPGHHRWSGMLARPTRPCSPDALADVACVAAGLLPPCAPWRRLPRDEAARWLRDALAHSCGVTRPALEPRLAQRAAVRLFAAVPREAAALVPPELVLGHTFESTLALVHPGCVAVLALYGED